MHNPIPAQSLLPADHEIRVLTTVKNGIVISQQIAGEDEYLMSLDSFIDVLASRGEIITKTAHNEALYRLRDQIETAALYCQQAEEVGSLWINSLGDSPADTPAAIRLGVILDSVSKVLSHLNEITAGE
jgi:hypothetical protein